MTRSARHLSPRLLAASLAAVVLAALPLTGGTAQAATGEVWFVQAGATQGNGSASAPLGSTAEVERLAGPGDQIVLLPSDLPLDGGLVLAKGQTLTGRPGAVVTNTTDRLEGDGVRLADHTTVTGVTFRGTRRAAVQGTGVTDVRIADNDIAGHNTDCVDGFLIPQFNAPTNLPGVGIPIVGGLQNGWAGIMIDADNGTTTARITGNHVHDAECGDGIDVRAWGDAEVEVTIARNQIDHLRQGPDFASLLAVGLQARDNATLTARVDSNRQEDLGNADDPNLITEGADSEGVFINGVGPADMRVTVTRNVYLNEKGLGGFSANGLEMVSMGAGTRIRTVVRDSFFSGSPGDVIEEGALGTDADLRMVLDNVTAEKSTGVGNTLVLPFNNGDCVLAGSLGARNSVHLQVRDSVLRGCHNNGLSVGSNVTNGRGPTTRIAVDVVRTIITGNGGNNLSIRNFTPLDSLSVKVQDSDLRDSGWAGTGTANFSAENLTIAGSSVIDLGGGSLGSTGGNCLGGRGLFSADVVGYDVAARRNWWGRRGGPGLLDILALNGSLDSRAALSAAPVSCP